MPPADQGQLQDDRYAQSTDILSTTVPSEQATILPDTHNTANTVDALTDELIQLMVATQSRLLPLLNSVSQDAVGEIIRLELSPAVSNILARGNALVQPQVIRASVSAADFVALQDVEMQDATEIATMVPYQENDPQDLVMQDASPVEGADATQVDEILSESAYLEFLSSCVQGDSGYGTQG